MTSTIKVNTVTTESGSTLTIGGCGKTVALASGASQTGFGRSGSVDWQTGSIKTSEFTAASGEGYFCNTSGGAFTVNLPAGSAGAIVSFADYTRTFQTNALTINPNGSEKIGGIAQDAVLNIEGQAATFVYVDSTEGWINVQNAEDTETGLTPAFVAASGGTVTTVCTNFKVHTFTSPGTFTVSNAGNSAGSNEVSYVVVGGAGGGGGRNGGGGGAGGYREAKSPATPYTASPLDGYSTPANRVTISATAFPITVGGGGAGGINSSSRGGCGSASIFSTITSAGGGGAGSFDSPNSPVLLDGQNGGSGGGGATTGGSPAGAHAGGTGNTPPVSPAQGNDGGDGYSQGGASLYPNGAVPGGGGGGAGAVGQDYNTPGANTAAAAGGAGVTSSITGSPVARSGGGGGGSYAGSPATLPGGAGGTGGGGAGKSCQSSPRIGTAGTANTGGGGGGGGDGSPAPTVAGGAGGSGIVIIRYKFQ